MGYAFADGLGVELMAGYLSVSEKMTRRVEAAGESSSPTFVATDYLDSTRLRGPMTAVSASYRILEKTTPLTARIGVGLASLTSTTSNRGTFTSQGSSPEQASSSVVSVGEASQHLLTPFGSTELRFGYRVTKLVTVDIGATILLFVPPNVARVGTNNLAHEIHRATDVNGNPNPGVLRLPDEHVAGAFIALSPSFGVRADF